MLCTIHVIESILGSQEKELVLKMAVLYQVYKNIHCCVLMFVYIHFIHITFTYVHIYSVYHTQ